MVTIFSKPGMHRAKSQSTKSYSEATVFPVLSIENLLPEIEKNHYLNKVQEIVTLSDEYFKIFYENLIENFALFVQVLPEVYGEELGGLLNDGLRRALLAIRLLHENRDPKPHPLFVFAVFSIALLADVGQILRYRVMISDENGVFLDDWYPFLGSMPDFGEFYKLRPYEETPQSLVRGATPIIARQLLNETSITWLSSNNQIFDMWLSFLNKGEDWAGGLAKILKIDPKELLSRKAEVIGIIPLDIKTFDPMGTDLGEKFLAWLKKGLDDGSISYNEANSTVHVVKTNELDLSVFLQSPELFQQFCNIYAKTRDWIVVSKQFNLLGLTKLSGSDVKFEQFFSDTQEAKTGKLGFLSSEKGNKSFSQSQLASANHLKEGLVIKDAKMLFGAKVPPVSQFVREIEMRWGLDNVMPKARNSQGANSNTQAPPENRLKI
ncbi:MAG: DNA-binding domain-containing protein [Gammaproteobacteria bacterium]|nr:DNA-binding domain-containing protein [Gammaproteobacteria bacterium]